MEDELCFAGMRASARHFSQTCRREGAKLKKFSDAGGLKYSGCPTPAETDS